METAPPFGTSVGQGLVPGGAEEGERKTCEKCGLEIVGQLVKTGGMYFHQGCFVCSACTKPLTGSFGKQADGKRVCLDCVPKTYCEACKKVIQGTATKVGGANYHPDCFTCEGCRQRLVGGFINVTKGGQLMRYCNQECLVANGDAPVRTVAAPPTPRGSVTAPPTPRIVDVPVTPRTENKNLGWVTPLVTPRTPAAAAAAPAPAGQAAPLGAYHGTGRGTDGSDISYSVRLMEGCRCWLDHTTRGAISNATWHVEGGYVEEGDTLRLGVESRRGGGPEIGTVVEVRRDAEDRETLIYEGLKLLPQRGVPQFDETAVTARAPKKSAPPAATAEAAPTKGGYGGGGAPNLKRKDSKASLEVAAAGVVLADRAKVWASKEDSAPRRHSFAGRPSLTTQGSRGSLGLLVMPVASGATTASSKTSVAVPEEVPPPGCMSLADLQSPMVWKPRGVDAAKRESLLSDATFEAVFGMNKEAFAVLPKWKRDKMKQQVDLF